MNKIKMTCGGSDIIFTTNSQKMTEYFMTDQEQIPETIPGIKMTQLNSSDDTSELPRLQYIDAKDRNASIDPIKNQAEISVPERELYIPDLVYLALSMFAKELNKNDKYFIHAAVIEKDGLGTVMSGEPGSGKTTLALQFCMKNGYNFVANDRAIMGLKNGIPKIYNGTMQTHIRLGVIHQYFPKLIPKIDPVKIQQPWNNKIYI
ncbi:MAG: hypothetical protein LBM09_00195, partial [Candidatus Nomurabacteria bacterium]|nr:hypothetical protein [Candidatus Nomurabacteria bacterium]